MLRNADWYLVTNLSRHPSPETSVTKYQYALRNIPEERRYHSTFTWNFASY